VQIKDDAQCSVTHAFAIFAGRSRRPFRRIAEVEAKVAVAQHRRHAVSQLVAKSEEDSEIIN
jgi:hypothetical protein